MNRFILILIFTSLQAGLLSQPWIEHGGLIVDKSNPHYISYEDGTPFLWFGDTGWEMINRLSREEIKYYLEDRRAKGFNVIQTVILSEFNKINPVNYYGDSIFLKNDPCRPAVTPGSDPMISEEYDFWDHVEFAVSTAALKGLYIALLPTWGEWVIPREGRAKFNTPKEAYNYGWFVADRLKGYKNIIWILGGDRHPDERKGGTDLWRSMAEGIADATNSVKSSDGRADYTTTLMSYHSYSSSSEWFHADPWIDFHMWGSYHADYYIPRAWQLATSDWNLNNPKPTINGEPNYEDHPVNYGIESNGFFTATDVRMAAYWSMFSGCAGITYGAHAVWQFTDHSRPPYNKITLKTWQESIDLPGALDIILLKKLMESYPIKGLIPDQTMIISGQGIASNYVCAIRGESHAFIYVPTGSDITVKMGVIAGSMIDASWFNPRNGEFNPVGKFENTGIKKFSVPEVSKELSWLRTGRGCDWVLVLKGS